MEPSSKVTHTPKGLLQLQQCGQQHGSEQYLQAEQFPKRHCCMQPGWLWMKTSETLTINNQYYCNTGYVPIDEQSCTARAARFPWIFSPLKAVSQHTVSSVTHVRDSYVI